MAGAGSNIDAYFSHLVSTLRPAKQVKCLLVAHMVPNSVHLVRAVNSLVTLSAVLVKPKTVNRPEFTIIKDEFNTKVLDRAWASDARSVADYLAELNLGGQDTIFVDIGGYFSSSIDAIASRFDGKILGVLEGTENGVRRYEEHSSVHGQHQTLITTVARSPLKLPEDYLVASSLVFSIEAVLRDQAEILQTRRAAVIGYGRVGSAIAEILRNRGISTVVYDSDPIKLALAAARGFQALARLEDALSLSTLVVCATGSKALSIRGFGALKHGTVVASVTSSDDEFDLDQLEAGYLKNQTSNSITTYQENRAGGRHFSLIADGNAANFLHGAVIGPAIQLIEGEKLAAISALAKRQVGTGKGIQEVPPQARAQVAQIWNDHFL